MKANIKEINWMIAAPVMLTISTGSAPTYIGLTFVVTTILATGIALIKKFVL